jgi:hypothetical protein
MATVQRQINLKQNPNPNEGVVAAKKVSRVAQDPLDGPLWALTRYTAQIPKHGVATLCQILNVHLF